MTPPNIPVIYRLWFLWIEPAMALNGARYLWVHPTVYHEYMPITTAWHRDSRIVYDQLASTYILFAFNQAVTLRVVHDVHVWKVLLFGMVLCDAGHLYAVWAEVGTREMFSPGNWRLQDWVTWVTTVGPLFLRLAFVLGMGLGHSGRGKKGWAASKPLLQR
ncbi:hypothetical protein C7974DRAFT_311840 [Boeremia exigua]|uniref:uncharacterized protein n=1 Tax=Boeremia exigua TaxID=749465 RepID=UPI001E8EABC0|nr:uncharacterized protein C7974DRAFT_311840 [Boeremia exigua]KAH6629819.1 hypothetical protein C7974DRAFT_311840 [Boeremia exigua]